MKKLGLGWFSCGAAMLLAACASSDKDASPAAPAAKAEVSTEQAPVLGKLGGRFKGTFGAGRGMRFEPIALDGQAAQGAQGFKLDAASLFTFSTLSGTGDYYCSGANNCADCSSGTCGALGSPHPLFTDCGGGGAQTCGQVSVDPGGANLDDVWVVISGISASTGSVAFSQTDTPTSTYNPPLNTGTYYYKYGTLAGAASNKRMDLTYAGGFDPAADSVSFQVSVYYSTRHTSYALSGPAVASPPDACSGGTTLLDNTAVDDQTASFALPFPIAIYQLNASNASSGTDKDKGWVSENGVFGIGVPRATGKNLALPSTVRFGFDSAVAAVFWDDLILTDASAKVCMLTTGTAPSRSMVIRWNDVDSATNSGQKLTFSLVAYEGSDVLEYYYSEPSTGITSDSQGALATVGVQGTNPLATTGVATQIWHNTATLPSTGGAANYPVRYTLTPN